MKMNENKGECPFYRRNCPTGCKKADCRGFFPGKTLVIMESQKKVCESLEYLDCEQYKAALIWREDRRLSRKGCPFLSDKICGHPKDVWCKGNTPPFKIEADNFIESCYGNNFAECPNYATGIAFQEEAKRIKAKLNNAVVP